MSKRFAKILIVGLIIGILAAAQTAFAQKDVNYAGGKEGAVVFVHKSHVQGQKLKCNDCHTNLFARKKEAKITKAEHTGDKYCAACHNGKKAFSMATDADCAKCHKK